MTFDIYTYHDDAPEGFEFGTNYGEHFVKFDSVGRFVKDHSTLLDTEEKVRTRAAAFLKRDPEDLLILPNNRLGVKWQVFERAPRPLTR